MTILALLSILTISHIHRIQLCPSQPSFYLGPLVFSKDSGVWYLQISTPIFLEHMEKIL